MPYLEPPIVSQHQPANDQTWFDIITYFIATEEASLSFASMRQANTRQTAEHDVTGQGVKFGKTGR